MPEIPALTLESFIKVVAILGALLYAIGILVGNTYLIRQGISDYSVVRPQAVAAGAWAAVAACLFFAIGIFPIRVYQFVRKLRGRTLGICAASTAAVCSVTLTSWAFSAAAKASDRYEDYDFLRIAGVSAFLFACAGGIYVFFYRRHGSGGASKWALYVTAFGAICTSGLFLLLFTILFYEHIPRSYGGGASEYAYVDIKEPVRSHIAPLLWLQSPGTKLLGPMELVYANERILLMRSLGMRRGPLSSGKELFSEPAFMLERDAVDLIIPIVGGRRRAVEAVADLEDYREKTAKKVNVSDATIGELIKVNVFDPVALINTSAEPIRAEIIESPLPVAPKWALVVRDSPDTSISALQVQTFWIETRLRGTVKVRLQTKPPRVIQFLVNQPE